MICKQEAESKPDWACRGLFRPRTHPQRHTATNKTTHPNPSSSPTGKQTFKYVSLWGPIVQLPHWPAVRCSSWQEMDHSETWPPQHHSIHPHPKGPKEPKRSRDTCSSWGLNWKSAGWRCSLWSGPTSWGRTVLSFDWLC